MEKQIWIDHDRQWQAQIWVDRDKSEPPTVLYGETIAKLKSNIKQNILASNPHTSILTSRRAYLYSDGTTKFPEDSNMLGQRKTEERKYTTYKEGWYEDRANTLPQYDRIGTLEELTKRILATPIFEKGPRYEDQTIVNGMFLLSMIQVTKLIDANVTSQVNNCLQRGWHILHIDDKLYHLGHEDPDAL